MKERKKERNEQKIKNNYNTVKLRTIEERINRKNCPNLIIQLIILAFM